MEWTQERLDNLPIGNRNEVIRTIEKYGDNCWWESNDPRTIAVNQLAEEILMVNFSFFHKCVEQSLNRPIRVEEFIMNRESMINEIQTQNSHLLMTCTPPRAITPILIEWWLELRKCYKDFADAEIFQIESANIEDAEDSWHHSKVFTGDKTPSIITYANTKTETITYYEEDAEGNLIIDPITRDLIPITMHNPDILIYRCLPRSTIKDFAERGNSEVLGKRI